MNLAKKTSYIIGNFQNRYSVEVYPEDHGYGDVRQIYAILDNSTGGNIFIEERKNGFISYMEICYLCDLLNEDYQIYNELIKEYCSIIK